MNMLVQLLLVCFLPICLSARCDIQGHDIKYPETGWRVRKCGFTITNALETGQLSLLECGQRCEQVDACKAFYYTFENQECKLQGQLKVKRTPSSSTVFYKRTTKVSNKVAFHAEDIDSNSIAVDYPIIFKKAILNDGGLYNADTGKFTAAKKGVYSFAVNICVSNNKWFQVHIVTSSNKVVASTAIKGDPTGGICASASGNVDLNPGDSAWVKTTYYDQGGEYQDGRRHQTFSGGLLYAY